MWAELLKPKLWTNIFEVVTLQYSTLQTGYDHKRWLAWLDVNVDILAVCTS